MMSRDGSRVEIYFDISIDRVGPDEFALIEGRLNWLKSTSTKGSQKFSS